jgi:hypothetical protein
MKLIEVLDPRLEPVARGAHLERLCTGAIWGEGPANESVLCVSDTSAALSSNGGGNHQIMAFDVRGTQLTGMRRFAEIMPGLPDGLRVDRMGWSYTSSDDSVQVLHPHGSLLGRIPVPESALHRGEHVALPHLAEHPRNTNPMNREILLLA